MILSSSSQSKLMLYGWTLQIISLFVLLPSPPLCTLYTLFSVIVYPNTVLSCDLNVQCFLSLATTVTPFIQGIVRIICNLWIIRFIGSPLQKQKPRFQKPSRVFVNSHQRITRPRLWLNIPPKYTLDYHQDHPQHRIAGHQSPKNVAVAHQSFTVSSLGHLLICFSFFISCGPYFQNNILKGSV